MSANTPSREDYTRQQSDSYARLMQAANSGAEPQQNKNNGRYTEAGGYNPVNNDAGNFMFLEDNVIVPGTIIHAVLVSRIDTDYPGPIHARVIENVYDSKTGKNLLIPQGTILQGNYSSSSVGVAKVQIAWESMVVNFDGVAYQVSLGGMAGVDKRGRAGINGWLDDHYFEWLKAAGIVTLFTMLNSEMAYQTQAQRNSQLRQLMDINQGIVNQLGSRIMDRALNIQPSVKVPNGKAVSVSVNTPVSLRPFKAFKAEQKWVR
jgi:type IV secretion system protein VirB10